MPLLVDICCFIVQNRNSKFLLRNSPAVQLPATSWTYQFPNYTRAALWKSIPKAGKTVAKCGTTQHCCKIAGREQLLHLNEKLLHCFQFQTSLWNPSSLIQGVFYKCISCVVMYPGITFCTQLCCQDQWAPSAEPNIGTVWFKTAGPGIHVKKKAGKSS